MGTAYYIAMFVIPIAVVTWGLFIMIGIPKILDRRDRRKAKRGGARYAR